ncbi:MAG: preprotein translocase subunit SecY [Candidatus Brocadiae bacterium]|nr:preprotein translocase subunit SecY [Candidatus Brocadiia bacterium]
MSRFFQVIRNIFSIPELRRRILFTLGILAAFRFGAYIPLVGIDLNVLGSMVKAAEGTGGGRFLGWLNVFSGGAMDRMSLLSLGIMPYISASIIFQLLTKVVPRLEAVAKEGPGGARKIANWTRLSTIPICLVQAIFLVKFLGSSGANAAAGGAIVPDPGIFSFYIPGVLGLLAGTMIVIWLGDQITEHGVGNGASLIIMTGIVGRMPQAFMEMRQQISAGALGADSVIIIVGLYLLMLCAIVFTTQAQRRIPVQHGKHFRGRRMYGGAKHYLPLRVNQAGVMPVIFASSIMVLPGMFAQQIGWETGIQIFGRYGFIFSVLYVLMVYFFTFFWTALFFQPTEMSNQLKEHGSFVPGYRPGRKTAEHLEHVMTRVTVVGATFLACIALIPDLVSQMLHVDRFLTSFLGGTGILIVVGVGLDVMQKIESYLLMRQYEGFMKKGRIRGRK